MGISNLFVHLDAEVFPEPYAFKPERWLETYSGTESLDHWLVAFSKGPRSCLGMKYVAEVVLLYLVSSSFSHSLGWCELVLGFANVFRRFELKLDGIR